jgi:rhodanese-related sulfurtransferase
MAQGRARSPGPWYVLRVTNTSGGGTAGVRSIDEILAEARTRLDRVGPDEARAAMSRGAVLVDIRTQAQRAEQGRVPGAIHVERNVLEWRFDPQSPARLPQAGYDVQVILFCVDGYASSLAAVDLQKLGLVRATDLDGGFHAWEKAGLPVVYGDEPANGVVTRA